MDEFIEQFSTNTAFEMFLTSEFRNQTCQKNSMILLQRNKPINIC
jgi:hypothetical protein